MIEGLYRSYFILDGLSGDLEKSNGYDSLFEQYEALQNEVDNLRGVVADQGADAVGGVSPLDDAMYEVAKLLENIQDLIDEKEQDADKIRDLEKAVEDAKDAIKEMIPKTDPNPDPNPNPNPNPDPDPDPNPNPNPNPDPDPDPNPNPNPDPDPNPDSEPTTKINWKPLAAIKDFSGVFPFCIPFDIINMISSLNATPKAPVFEIPFEIQGLFKEKIVVDLSVLNPIMPFVRLFILLAFAIALARFSSSVIKW